MINTLLTFAADTEAKSGGLSSLGINVKGFLFQLITFVLVLLLLRKYVYGQLVGTLEARRKTVLDSIEQAKQASNDLEQAEERVNKLIAEARKESSDIVAIAHKEAAAMVEDAETKAQKRADHIVGEAKAQLDGEILKAKAELKKETRLLVADATEAIIGQKLNSSSDEKLIEQALAEVK